jgi:hypothetical protein
MAKPDSKTPDKPGGSATPGDEDPRKGVDDPIGVDDLTPTGAVQLFLQRNPVAGTVLLGGLAVIGVAAIAWTWQVDIRSAGLMGTYIAGLGAILYTITLIVTDQTLKMVVAWFAVVLLIAVCVVFFISAAFARQTWFAPAPCLVRFWERCETVSDEIAERQYTPPTAVKSTIPPVEQRVEFDRYQVKVFFAGVIRRQDVIDMSQKFRSLGWRMERPDRGGERTPQAAGQNEVRYSEQADEAAASELARLVQASNIVSEQITVRREASLAPGNLEAWLSR